MNGWTITNVTAIGTLSSQAPVITRDSPSMIVNSIVESGNIAVQLPTSPQMGDLIEVCVSSTCVTGGYVWYATTQGSSLYLWEEVPPGKCRSYRYISGPSWNRYS